MKLPKKLPPPSKGDKRLLAASVVILVASAVIAVLAIQSRLNPNFQQPAYVSDINGNPVEPPKGTLAPAVSGASDLINQMTAIPNAAPLTGQLAADVHAVSDMVSSCMDYNPQRREEMNTHIGWLLQPSTLPKDMIIALGNNINGRLIFGMATYTLGQWGELKKSPTSCLLPIGKKLNDMLATNGEERFKEFDVG